ncbi:3'-5' exonuclease [Streptacidiphilus anmyonensis]|uniref:3'-5' exonuclease n=1 Tax=Streptacidiphilus anmyonensis TaxID=405782 RepID=UPI0005AA5ED8|nr:3'-5' exonuclease [Streptacidiphilus anmyonensis]
MTSTPVRLAEDPALAATTLLVIDFEATTPAGHRPQPVEVAALAVRHVPGRGPQPTGWSYQTLIRPPAFAPVTSMMTRTTGIRPEDVADARTVDQVLAELDATAPAGPLLLVAQHAPVEASLLYDHRAHCPRLASTALLDTRLLAKALHPDLPGYGLDALITGFGLPRPADRHRALADCEVTALLLRRLLTDAARCSSYTSLADLVAVAGRPAKSSAADQHALF